MTTDTPITPDPSPATVPATVPAIALPIAPAAPPTPGASSTAAEWQNYLSWTDQMLRRADLAQLSAWRVVDIARRDAIAAATAAHAAAVAALDADGTHFEALAQALQQVATAISSLAAGGAPSSTPVLPGPELTPEEKAEMAANHARYVLEDRRARLLAVATQLFAAAMDKDLTPDASMIVAQAKGLMRAAEDAVPA